MRLSEADKRYEKECREDAKRLGVQLVPMRNVEIRLCRLYDETEGGHVKHNLLHLYNWVHDAINP